jgi:hypothetical protein
MLWSSTTPRESRYDVRDGELTREDEVPDSDSSARVTLREAVVLEVEMEHKPNFRQVEAVFVGRPDWENPTAPRLSIDPAQLQCRTLGNRRG